MTEETLPAPVEAAAGATPPPDAGVMPLLDHLGELRNRLFKSVLAVLVASGVGWFLATRVRNYLLDQLPGHKAQVLGPGDAFFIQVKISLTIGLILAMPVLLYQLWAFIAPGLTAAERRTIRPWIPLALLLFAIGVGIAYLVLPFAIAFLLELHRQPAGQRDRGDAVLRLRDDPVPRLRADHGVPDRPVRAGPGRDHQLRSGCPRTARMIILGIAASRRSSRPVATWSARPSSGSRCTS